MTNALDRSLELADLGINDVLTKIRYGGRMDVHYMNNALMVLKGVATFIDKARKQGKKWEKRAVNDLCLQMAHSISDLSKYAVKAMNDGKVTKYELRQFKTFYGVALNAMGEVMGYIEHIHKGKK